MLRITFFSLVMSILWSSLLIVLFSVIRKRRRFIDVCSISGLLILYLFCIIRMLIPIELWDKVRVIPLPRIYNPIYSFLVLNDLPGANIKPYKILLIVWAGVTLIILALQVVRYIRYGMAIDSLEKYGSSIEAKEYGIDDTGVTVIRTQSADTPFSFGIRRKRIIIPDKDYSDDELRLIIKHEYMHLRNHDLEIQLMIHFLCAIFWWNPLVYLLRFDIEQCFEIRCDRCVTKGMHRENITDYLELLLKIYKDGSSEGYEAWHGMRLAGSERDKRNNIRERFELIEAGIGNADKHTGRIMAVIMSGLVFALSYTFIFQAAYDTPKELIEDKPGANEATPDNTWIEKEGNRYFWVDIYGTRNEIKDEKVVEMMLDSGFMLYEDGK